MSIRNTRGKKVLSMLLTAVMVLALLPQTAYAAPDSKYINMNVAGEDVADSSKFLRQALEAPVKDQYATQLPSFPRKTGGDYDENLLSVWQYWDEVALSFFDSGNNYNKYLDGKTEAANAVSPLTQAENLSKVKEGSIPWFQTQVDKYRNSIINNILVGTVFDVRLKSLFDGTDFFTKAQLDAGTNEVFYFNRAIRDTSDSSNYRLKFITVVFYDFKLAPLEDQAAGDIIGDNIRSSLVDVPSPVRSYATVTSNYGSSGTVTGSQSVSSTLGASIENSSSNTSEYSFSETIGSTTTVSGSAPFGIGFEQSLNLEFSASQMFSKTTEKTLASCEETTNESSVSTDCPPQTVAVMATDSFNSTRTVNYQYPVAVQYKVQLICMHVRQDSSAGIWSTVYNLSQSSATGQNGSAVDALINRYNDRNVAGKEDTYKGPAGLSSDGIDPINWKTIVDETTALKNQERRTPEVLKDVLNDSRPYNSAGGSLAVSVTGTSSSVDKYAIYPLSSVRALSPFDEDYQVSAGSKLYVDGIPLDGRNANLVPYYGFDAGFGQWHLFDAGNNDISSGGNNAAALKTDSVTGRTYLEAGSASGSVYLKYVIDENRYNYYNNGVGLNIFAKNSDLTSTAMIRVNVNGGTDADTDAGAGAGTGDLPTQGADDPSRTGAGAGDLSTQGIGDSSRISKNVTAIRSPLKTLYLKKGKAFTPPVDFDGKDANGKAWTYKGYGSTPKLTWKSSKPKIAKVNPATGKITPLKKGKAKITATALSGKKITFTVKVVSKATKLSKLTLKKSPKSLKVGKTALIKPKLAAASATNQKVTFKSSKSSVLKVDKAGKLFAVKKGTAKITVKTGGKSKVFTVKVK